MGCLAIFSMIFIPKKRSSVRIGGIVKRMRGTTDSLEIIQVSFLVLCALDWLSDAVFKGVTMTR